MRTVLFYPRVEYMVLPSYAPLGIMSIATYLNQNGHCAVVYDRFFSNEKISSVIDEHHPDIIGISVISQTFIKDAIVISKAAKASGIPVIWGGCSSSAIAEAILKSGYADYVSFNEGEFTWLDIANAFDDRESFENIKGLAYLKNGEYIQTEPRDFIDLSTLPNIDWTLVNPENYMQKTYGMNKMLNIYMSKGCSGVCTFCYNPVFHKSTRRSRSIDKVIEEMRFLVENYGTDGFEFADEVMFANRAEAISFCNKILESGLNIGWSGYLKVSTINTAEDFELMHKAGCRSILYGVETGSERMLKKIHKPNTLKVVKRNLDLCAKSGIVPIATFIIGLPGETVEDVKQTISLAQSLKGALVAFFYFTPLPGTELYNELVSKKQLKSITTLEEHFEIIELERLYQNFSEIPTKDLIIIKEFMRLHTVFVKSPNGNNEQIIKVLISTIQAWSGRGVVHFVEEMFKTAHKVLRALSVFLHPITLKKYGLHLRK